MEVKDASFTYQCMHEFEGKPLIRNSKNLSYHYQTCIHCGVEGLYGKKYKKFKSFIPYGKYFVRKIEPLTKAVKVDRPEDELPNPM